MRKGITIWLTGLPCSGKTTIAKKLLKKIDGALLDGDVIRGTHISEDLGFSKEDRATHLSRMSSLAHLFSENGKHAVCSFVSPYIEVRDKIRSEQRYMVEVFVKVPVEECIKRDVKGMYKKAIDGIIPSFTGISAPYEEPPKAEITVETENTTVDECADVILNYLNENYKPTLLIAECDSVELTAELKSKIDDGVKSKKPVVLALKKKMPLMSNSFNIEDLVEAIEDAYSDEDLDIQTI